MCKIVLGIKHKGGHNEEFLNLLKAQYKDLKAERDGVCGLYMDKDGNGKVFRQMDDYDTLFEKLEDNEPNSRVILIHTRTGTSGSKDMTNVHLFESEGYRFAHNGFVSKYHTSEFGFVGEGNPINSVGKQIKIEGKSEDYRITRKYENDEISDMSDTQLMIIMDSCEGCRSAIKGYCKRHKNIADVLDGFAVDEIGSISKKWDRGEVRVEKKGKCDSLQFLENMPKPFTEKQLAEYVEETRFSGLGIIITPKNDIWAIIEKKCYLITNDNFTFLFSYSPEDKVEINKFAFSCGIPYVVDGEETEYESADVASGIWKIKVAEQKKTK